MKNKFLLNRRTAQIRINLYEINSKQLVTGLLLSFIGFVLIISLATDYFITSSKLLMLRNLAESKDSREIKPSSVSPEEVEAVQTIINRLTMPWGKLFSALESVSNDKIILISLEPNAEKKTVRLIAEAPDVYQMLDYIKALSRQANMSHVLLINQKASDDQNSGAVRFTVDAFWSK